MAYTHPEVREKIKRTGQMIKMKVIAIITEYDEIQKILSYLKKNKSPPFDKQTTKELIA